MDDEITKPKSACIEQPKTLEDEKQLICFLHFCSERINKGEPIQAIWIDYQNLTD